MAFAKKDRNISTGVYWMIGLAIFIASFIFYIVASNQKFFDDKYELYMFLPNVQGLNRGAFIALSGLKVGVVGTMEIVNDSQRRGIVVQLKVDKNYQDEITSSSVAMVKTLGILGDKYIDITIGDQGDRALQHGDYIRSDPGLDMYKIFANAENMVSNIGNILENTDSLVALAAQGRGVLGQFFTDERAGEKVLKVIKNIEEATMYVADGQGTLGKLISDPNLYNSLTSSSGQFHELLDSLQNGQGIFKQLLADPTFYPVVKGITAKTDSLLYKLQYTGSTAKMLNDEKLYENIASLSESLDSLAADMKRNPKRYVKLSLF